MARGGARAGAGRKSNVYRAAVASGEIKLGEKSHPPYRDVPCFVYIVHEIEYPDICKIGLALNAARRFSHLQVGTWRAMMLAQSFLLPTEEAAHIVERQVHGALQGFHRRGEWFAVSPDVAAREICDWQRVAFELRPLDVQAMRRPDALHSASLAGKTVSLERCKSGGALRWREILTAKGEFPGGTVYPILETPGSVFSIS